MQASGGFLGCVSPGLDEHVTEDTRDWIVENSHLALTEMTAQGRMLDVSWINRLFEAPGSLMTEPYWTGGTGAEATRYIDYGRKWIALLTGDFTLQEAAWIGEIHAVDARPRMKP